MNDLYELYKSSLKGYKKDDLDSYDKEITEIAAVLAEEDWFLIDYGFGGIEYYDGIDLCRLPFIKNVGLYPTRKDKNNVTYPELTAMSFYIRNKNRVDELSRLLVSKYKIIKDSAKSNLAGPETELAKLLLAPKEEQKQSQKQVQKVK